MKLENKKALVTGASRGIGKTITEKFIAEGAEVWGLSAREPGDLKERIERAGGKLHWLNADLGKTNEVEAVIEAAVKASGGFDILVNNAGITKDNLSFRMSVEDWQKVLDINLTAAFLIARTIGRDMIRRRSGSIINMSSVVGIHGNGGQANYAASKAGLIGVTKSLAQEVASRGVRVNAIAPGYIESDMTAAIPEEAKNKMIDSIPLKRTGRPEDVADAALFFASESSSYITGQVLSVDGGMFF
ncbi:MAG: 3-oxoacyl-[acyl-carrier-protein] reductase [Treponema sp.]|jgi:3-oxoacyl-[acyl-carrier protein] reductase|nr:3-oxoacyl-[acyl-carrier-protein] reductase [Treponema sp.]